MKPILFKKISIKLSQFSLVISAAIIAQQATAKITFEKEVKISDRGLYFDGKSVDFNAKNGGSGYDFVFGSRITPHGDCIKVYKNYVFMTWYRGGKNDRHVMLSRYNMKTGVTKTIEFPHRHTGFQNKPHLGESHNTIAVGIAPEDGTIHLLYDMHSYSEKRPADGAFKDDYFRYSFSKNSAADVADKDFTLNQFVNSKKGNYKHLGLRKGTDYRSLTYPNFFNNTKGELFMWIREGGNNNGAYKFAKYSGSKWSDFTQFNIMNAKKKSSMNENWGLYGDIKFESGKMRIGFAKRSNNNNDQYAYNNGQYFAYSDDPNGLTQWKDHNGKALKLPVINPEPLKASEPGDLFKNTGKNSVTMNVGADWTVTERGDIHMVTAMRDKKTKKNIHTYKKAGAKNFTVSTDFPGGNLYTYQNQVYLIGLEGGRIFVEKTTGGTNKWQRVYQSPKAGKQFRHGNVYIADGKLYFYLMQRKSGSAQPIYLHVYDLGLEKSTPKPKPVSTQKPTVQTTPTPSATTADNEGPQISITVEGSSESNANNINIIVNTSDRDGIKRVDLYLNNQKVSSQHSEPYRWINHSKMSNLANGEYHLRVEAFDNQGNKSTRHARTTLISSTTAIETSDNNDQTVTVDKTKPAEDCKNTTHIERKKRVVIDLSSSDCIQLKSGAKDKTLQLWDVKGSCAFRGLLTSLNGQGRLNINSNYTSTNKLTGTRFKFTHAKTERCNKIRLRFY